MKRAILLLTVLVALVQPVLAGPRGGFRSYSYRAPRAPSYTTPGYSNPSSVHVRSYTKPSTGSFVLPHYRSTPNSTRLDNWSTKGNVNPYTGKVGTKTPMPFSFR